MAFCLWYKYPRFGWNSRSHDQVQILTFRYTFFRENILALWVTKENKSCYSIILDSSKCWNTGTHSHPVVWMMNEGLYFKADSSFRIMYVWEVKQENRRLKIAARNIQPVTLHCYNQKFESRLKGNIQTFILLFKDNWESRLVDH